MPEPEKHDARAMRQLDRVLFYLNERDLNFDERQPFWTTHHAAMRNWYDALAIIRLTLAFRHAGRSGRSLINRSLLLKKPD